MRHKQFAVLLAVISFLGGCATTAAQTRPQLHQRPVGFWDNEKVVVQVLHIFSKIDTDANGKPVAKLLMAIGTGSVVDKDGLVLTNNHVVEKRPVVAPPDQPANQLVPLPPEIYMVCVIDAGVRDCDPAAVVVVDAERDLALVRVNRQFSKTVEFVDDKKLVPGDEVYFWGNIFGFLPPSPLFGRFVGRLGPPYYSGTDFSTQLPLLLMDINVSPGSSGSPIFNELGKAVGVASGYLPSAMGGRSLGIVIPSSTVKEFLKENRPKPEKK